MRGDITDNGIDLIAVGDVKRPCLRAAAARGDLRRDGLRALGRKIRHGDIGAFGGEHQRGGAAHAAGGAGDENGQSLDRAAELFEFGHGLLAGGEAVTGSQH